LINTRGDLRVGHALRRVEDRLCANDIAMRTRVRRRATHKLATLLVAEGHLVWRFARHHQQIRRHAGQSFQHPPGIYDDDH
jgi:uncharacterized protein (DUF2384 family)